MTHVEQLDCGALSTINRGGLTGILHYHRHQAGKFISSDLAFPLAVRAARFFQFLKDAKRDNQPDWLTYERHLVDGAYGLILTDIGNLRGSGNKRCSLTESLQ